MTDLELYQRYQDLLIEYTALQNDLFYARQALKEKEEK